MIGTTGAAVLLLVSIVFASVLGSGAGALISFVLRRPWGLRAALTDAVLAAVVAVIAACVVSAIDNARGVWESRVGLVLAIALGSVVLRHLFRLAFRFAR
jgi:putative flippase GtrA